MAISKRGCYRNPKKSPYNFEQYDSELEHLYMQKLDSDPEVEKWQKRHGISIPWIDTHGRKHQYRPDFLVQYANGDKRVIEVKDPRLIDSQEVQRKRRAAETWCQRRGMLYAITTI